MLKTATKRADRFHKSIQEKIEDGNIEIPDHLFKKYQEKTLSTIDKIKEINLPKPGEQIRLVTMNSFNTIAFIQLIARKETILHLILIIFAINLEAAQTIANLKNSGRIKKLTVIVSSIRNAGHKIKSKAIKLLRQNQIKLIFVNSHAKISAIKTATNHYIIEGSGNMSYNGRIEQYVIDNDENLFKFTENWINEIKIAMKNKPDYIEL